MQNHTGKFKAFEFDAAAFRFSLLVFSFLAPVILFADQPDTPVVKWLSVYIRADVNEVRFENIWVFQRHKADRSWDVVISLPDDAVVLRLDEPNETELPATGRTIRKDMTADSLIDSIGFSLALPNQAGTCQTQIVPDYNVASIVVFVSGSAVRLVSNVLKYDEFRTSRSNFSSVYTADNVAAGTKVGIELKHLPCKARELSAIVCITGLALIVIIALFTIYYNRTASSAKLKVRHTLERKNRFLIFSF